MTKRIKKKKRAKRSSRLAKNRESIAGLVAIISVLFFIITIILWGISELVDRNFIMSEMIGAYCAASIFLCFSIMFIAIIIGTRNWFAKIICSFSVCFMLLGSYSFIETAIFLYKDKTAFENKQFKRIVAIPTGAEFDDPEYGTEFLMELVFNDLTIDVYSLNISRSDYLENLSGKSLEISYLPNSRYAVSVKEHFEDTQE